MQRQANKFTKAERLKLISELLADGKLSYEIYDICKEKWGICERQVRRYLDIVYKYLGEQVKEKDKDKIILEYDRLIAKYEAKDPKMAYLYRLQRDKILGISSEKINLEVKEIKVKLPRHRGSEEDND